LDVLKSSTYPYYTSTYKDLYLLNNPYSFHFNGQEADDEIAGMGNIMSAEFWEYDTRLGRRWNCDPITYPWNSSYCVLNNNPISNIDPDGLESIPKPSGRGIGNRVYNGIGYVLMAIRNLFASSGNQRVWDYHPPTNNSNYSGWLKKILQPIC
jgi:RHS repeat-associated protein